MFACHVLCEIGIWQANMQGIIYDWWKFWEHFCGCFDFESRVARKAVVICSRRFIKHSRLYFITYPNAYRMSKILCCASYFPPLLSVFCILMKHCLSCVIYWVFQKKSTPPRRMGFWKFSQEGGGGQRLWKSSQEGIWTEKKLAQGSLLTTTSVKKLFEELSALPSVQLHQNLTVHSAINIFRIICLNRNNVLKPQTILLCTYGIIAEETGAPL